MTYLLDTHVWLWMLASPERLSAETLGLVGDSATDLVLSAGSSWEIAVKYGLGRLPLPEAPASFVPTRMQKTGVRGLAVEHRHTLAVAELPAHHRDPFDRLLIAQARMERMTVITADPVFARYEVPCHPA